MNPQNISKFNQLSAVDKKFFIEAWLTLGFMRAAILTISFKHLTRSLRQQEGGTAPPPLDSRELETALAIARGISRAANHTPWESACLVQSLTARRMLQRRNIPGNFQLGVKKEKTEMQAHAWTRCGDSFITGYRGHEEFIVVSTFSWGSQPGSSGITDR